MTNTNKKSIPNYLRSAWRAVYATEKREMEKWKQARKTRKKKRLKFDFPFHWVKQTE